MNFFEKFIHFLQAEGETPEIFGIFHIICVIVIAALTLFLCLKMRDCDDKTFRSIIFCIWITMVVLEVYRELVFSLDVENGIASWDYAWYQFPFQLCATPLYVLPLVAFLKNGIIRDAAMFYIATFALFGGLVVMVYPGDVLCSYIGINLQSMIHHGFQVVAGFFCIVYNRRKYTNINFLKAVSVFAVLISVAMVLNLTVYNALLANGMDDTFNMFFISPYFDCTLPVLDKVYDMVPYPVFLIIYILGFSLIAALIFYMSKLIISKTPRSDSKCV